MPEFKSVSVDEDDNFYSWFGRFWYENYQKNNYTTSAKQMLGTMAEFAYRAGRESAAQAGNSPVIPEGYVMVPKEPTPEILAVITEAIKSMRGSAATYARVLAAAPQPQSAPQNIPEIIPGWIPVSERMPGSQEWVIVFAKWANQQVLCWDDVQNRWTDFEDQSYYADMFTHWMPLPAAPQEVKGEQHSR
ncbi:DUF551 domain-containing protein [Klebsiella michiganensis]